MRLRPLMRLFFNRRYPGYYLLWATLAFLILLVVFLADRLWVDAAIVGVFLVLCAALARPSANSVDRYIDKHKKDWDE